MKKQRKSYKPTLHKSTLKNLSQDVYGGMVTLQKSCPPSTTACEKINLLSFAIC